MWILLVMFVLLILLAVGVSYFAFIIPKKVTPDYYALYLMGLIWLPTGIVIGDSGLGILGTIFMAVGLIHKKSWKRNHKPWSKLTKKQKKEKIRLTSWILGLVIVGLMFFLTAYLVGN